VNGYPASAPEIAQAVCQIHDDYQRESDRLKNDVLPHLQGLEQRAMSIIRAALAHV